MSKLFKILLITCFGLFSFTIANANEAPVSFSDMVQKALPAVVNISATQKAEHGRKLQLHEIPENPFELFDFFQNDLNQDSPRKEYSLGSGFIIDPKGYIITNYHVVGNADVVEVGLDGEPTKRYKAKIIGKDKKTDLALLKITPDKDLPYLELGDSDKCRVGDWVITIGNPYGLGGTVTKGIISAKARQLNTGQFDDYIQTDAPINRGNSGGPMIAMDGRVIAVNTVILSPSGGSIGIGFAIPTSLVNNIITQLRDHGQVSRSWLGVKVQQVDDKIAKGMGLSSAKGALVVEVTPDSPAEKAGVMVGDIITRFNSTDINSTQKLPLVVADTPAGESVVMTVFRDKSYKNIKIKVELAPKDASETTSEDAKAPTPSYAHTTAFGLTVREVDPVLRKRYLIDQEIQGVLIAKISEAIQANDLGLRTGDVILKINQETLKSLKDFNVAMERVKESGDKAVVLLLHSRGQNRFVVLDLTE